MNRITVLRNLIWSYEALANPTPEDTQEYEENKEELHRLLSLKEGTEIEEELPPGTYESNFVELLDNGVGLFVVIKGPHKGKSYKGKLF